MNKIIFVTGNKRKIDEANACLAEYGLEVQVEDCDINEVQSHDPQEITIEKAKAAYKAIGKPLVVNDHHWSIEALNGFPGGYMKDVNNWFEPEDFLALMLNKTNREASLTECIVYFDGEETKTFKAEFPGSIVEQPKGIGYVSFERVFKYDDADKTIAEQHDSGGEGSSFIERSAWKQFGAWYAKQV